MKPINAILIVAAFAFIPSCIPLQKALNTQNEHKSFSEAKFPYVDVDYVITSAKSDLANNMKARRVYIREILPSSHEAKMIVAKLRKVLEEKSYQLTSEADAELVLELKYQLIYEGSSFRGEKLSFDLSSKIKQEPFWKLETEVKKGLFGDRRESRSEYKVLAPENHVSPHHMVDALYRNYYFNEIDYQISAFSKLFLKTSSSGKIEIHPRWFKFNAGKVKN